MSIHFSIIIPTYNYGHLVERAIKSVCQQQYSDFEVIVINDGSTDETKIILESLAQKYPIRIIHQDNLGPGTSRNKGIDLAQFEWLIFLDADDELYPGALQAYAEAIEINPMAKMIIGSHQNVFDDSTIEVRSSQRLHDDKLKNLQAYLFKNLSIVNGGCAMHTQVFKFNRYPGHLRQTEDVPVFAHALSQYDVASCDAITAKIYKHKDSRRHDIAAAEKVGMALETIIFEASGLPEQAGRYRKAYRGHRALSLVKLAYRQQRYDMVSQYFNIALRATPLRSLAPRYLRRFLVSVIKR